MVQEENQKLQLENQKLIGAVDAKLSNLTLSLQPATLTSPSRAELGRVKWDACQSKLEGISATDESAVRLFTQQEHEALKKTYDSNPDCKENAWVALVTPRLMEMVDSVSNHQKCVVNSELIAWIRTAVNMSEHYQKPDLFVCDKVAFIAGIPPSITTKSVASARVAASFRRAGFLFGSCAWQLRDSVLCIFEGKVKITLHEAIGEIFPKMQNLLNNSSMAAQKCCLFDKDELYLLTFTSSGLFSSHRFRWTTPGSYQVLSDFICPPTLVEPTWLRTLRKLCSKFHVEPVMDGATFLGAGGTGKVFKVKDTGTPAVAVSVGSSSSSSSSFSTAGAAAAVSSFPAASPAAVALDSSPSSASASASSSSGRSTYALKLVDAPHYPSLQAEHSNLHEILSRPGSSSAAPTPCLPHSISALKSIRDDTQQLQGGGFMLTPVGACVSSEVEEHSPARSDSQAKAQAKKAAAMHVFVEIMDILLRLHRQDIVHGDPRLPNVIRTGDARQLVWIDLREAEMDDIEAIPGLKLQDLQKCVDSFIRHYSSRAVAVGQYAIEVFQSPWREAYLAAAAASAVSDSSQLWEQMWIAITEAQC